MTTWVTEHKRNLDAAQRICLLFGVTLTWQVGTQGIRDFWTRPDTGDHIWRKWGEELDSAPYHEKLAEQWLALILQEVMGIG
jgi:hypothetical protein